jgi:hypothetical protein
MKHLSLMALMYLYVGAVYSNCLKKPSSIDVKDYIYAVGKGSTYKAARLDLNTQLPKVGLHQKIDLMTHKVSVGDSYSESTAISKSVFANFEFAVFDECKAEGEYFVSVAVPKSKVSYLPRYPLIVPDKFKSYSYVKKLCGKHKKMMIIMSGPFASWESQEQLHGHRLSHKGFHYDLLCGDVKLKVKRCSRHNGCWSDLKYDNSFDDFKAYYIPTRFEQRPVRDHSDQWRLELMKEFFID